MKQEKLQRMISAEAKEALYNTKSQTHQTMSTKMIFNPVGSTFKEGDVMLTRGA